MADATAYNEVAGGYGVFYGLEPGNKVLLSAYRTFMILGAMPNGDIPAHVGVGYSAAASNRIYSVTGSGGWLLESIGYPEAQDPTSLLGKIEDGIRFRNSREIFAWQSFGRVYNYVW